MAFTELANNFPSRVIIDSSMALPVDRMLQMKELYKNEDDLEDPLPILMVECKPHNEFRWHPGFEDHVAAIVGGDSRPYEPTSAEEEVQSLVASCEFSDDFERNVHRLVVDVDITNPLKTLNDDVEIIVKRIHELLRRFDPDYFSDDEREDGDGRKRLRHVSHPRHYLYLTEAEGGEIRVDSIHCALCRQGLSAPFFGCSICRFYLHKSCAELPNEIAVPYHEHTKFILKPMGEIHPEQKCTVCDISSGVLYKCEKCFRVEAHLECAKLPQKLIHPCHEHELVLRIHTEPEVCQVHLFMCCACGARGGQTSYFCEECNHHFHVDCALRLEKSVIHKCHWHELILSSPPKDDTNEYYCEVCAQRRHPEFWIYYCEECEYEAHISCVNPRVGPYDPGMVERSPAACSRLIYLEEPEDYMEFGRYEWYVESMNSAMRVEY